MDKLDPKFPIAQAFLALEWLLISLIAPSLPDNNPFNYITFDEFVAKATPIAYIFGGLIWLAFVCILIFLGFLL